MIHNQDERPAARGWRDQAACAGMNGDLFFPAAESGAARDAQVAAAKAVCGRCAVRAQCLTEALARIPYGIAGGLTEDERRRLRGRAERRPEPSGLSAQAREVLSDGPDHGMSGRDRARVGRELLVAGQSPRQVASACRVGQRTAERWATSTASSRTDGRAHQGAGEGSTAATALPSGSPQHTTPRAGTRAPEGHERR